MTILVDPAMWPWRGRLWAHLVSDSSHEELHAFAARLDIPRQVFQGDHYDVRRCCGSVPSLSAPFRCRRGSWLPGSAPRGCVGASAADNPATG